MLDLDADTRWAIIDALVVGALVAAGLVGAALLADGPDPVRVPGDDAGWIAVPADDFTQPYTNSSGSGGWVVIATCDAANSPALAVADAPNRSAASALLDDLPPPERRCPFAGNGSG